MRRPGPKTVYALSALATVLLVAAAAFAASGIDIGRPRATDLPVVVARSTPAPTASASVVPTVAAPAPAETQALAPAQAVESGPTPRRSARSSATDAKPAVVTPPAPADAPHHGHEVVTPPVREGGHASTKKVTTPKAHD